MDILKIAMIGMAGVCLAIPLKSYKAEYGMLISLGTCVCILQDRCGQSNDLSPVWIFLLSADER